MLPLVTAGVDGSPESLAAAGWAAREAQRRNSPLRIIHAWELPPAPQASAPANAVRRYEARRILREAEDHVHTLCSDLHVDDRQALVPPSTALWDASTESSLLVLGSRRVSGITGFLVRSVALHVAGRAECPVVLVPARGRTEGEHPADTGRPVVIGIDLGHPCDETIEFAYEAARLRGAAVHFLHACGPTAPHTGIGEITAPEAAAEPRHMLEAVIRQWHAKYPDITATGSVPRGRAASHLLRASRGAGLLVLGRSRRQWLIGPHTGAVTRAVVRHALCPVAVVPHD